MNTPNKNNSTTDTRNADRDPDYNKNTDKYRDPDSKTFNEDEESWKNKNSGQQGTTGNDWDANDAVSRSKSYRYEDEQRDATDYISSDHSDYNRGNSRFGWYDSEENF